MGDSDLWVCTSCRSVNPIKSGRCYKCHAPKAVAGAKQSEMSVTDTARAPVLAAGVYRSSEGRAVLLSLMTVVFILATAAALVWLWWIVEALARLEDPVAKDALVDERLPIVLVAPGVGFLTLLCYGAWISRVVSNVGAVGAGFSRVGPTMAFIEPLLPGINLYSIPARVGEIMQRLDDTGRGLLLVGASWLLVVGPAIVVVIFARVGRFADSAADLLKPLMITLFGSFAIQAVGLLVGLAAVWYVEGLFRARVAGSTST